MITYLGNLASAESILAPDIVHAPQAPKIIFFILKNRFIALDGH